jgi:hypothetical protein
MLKDFAQGRAPAVIATEFTAVSAYEFAIHKHTQRAFTVSPVQMDYRLHLHDTRLKSRERNPFRQTVKHGKNASRI